jgi:hypothetical protein
VEAQMSITIDLPADTASKLAAAAERRGISLSQHVAELLQEKQAKESASASGANLVAYWEAHGLIGSRPDIADSQEHARALRVRAERRE